MNIEKTHQYTLEEVLAEFFDPDALKTEPRKIHRLDIEGNRNYYILDEFGNPTFYHSISTVIRAGLPTSPYLIDWIVEKGKEGAEAYRDERAAFGSFMHTLFGDLLINKTLDLDAIEIRLEQYLTLKRYPITWMKWAFELKSACLAFAQWIIDYKVKPIAIEIALASDSMGIAGMLDLACTLSIEEKGFFGETYKTSGPGRKKGDPKESKKSFTVKAIVDFKSGKNFYEEHEIQLAGYRSMWNENFTHTDDQITRIFNWSPKEWRGTTPTYNFKEQTDTKRLKKLKPIIELAKIEKSAEDKTLTIVSGVIDLTKGIERNIIDMDYGTAVRNHHKPKEESHEH